MQESKMSQSLKLLKKSKKYNKWIEMQLKIQKKSLEVPLLVNFLGWQHHLISLLKGLQPRTGGVWLVIHLAFSLTSKAIISNRSSAAAAVRKLQASSSVQFFFPVKIDGCCKMVVNHHESSEKQGKGGITLINILIIIKHPYAQVYTCVF